MPRLSLLPVAALASSVILLGACGGRYVESGEISEGAGATGGATASPTPGGAPSVGGLQSAGGSRSVAGSPSGGAGTGGGGAPFTPAACPCTRRPAGANSSRCTRGLNESSSADLSVTGGTLYLKGEQGFSSGVPLKLEIPPNALSGATTVEVTETGAAPPAGLVDLSPVYVVAPQGVELRLPMKLTIPYGSDVEFYQNVAIYAAPDLDGAFVPLADSYTNAGFMQGSTSRFGAFVVGMPRTAPGAPCP